MRDSKPTVKLTELREIPKEWEVVSVGDIISFIKGKKPAEMSDDYKEGYLPYLSTEYLRNNGEPKFAKPSPETISVNDGDLILLWDGSNAGEFFIGKKGILSSTMVKFQLKKENINSMFLLYLLKTKEYHLSGQTRGTGIPHVDKNVLESLLIPLPPLPEQRRIAEVLGTIDESIQRVGEAIAKTERLKKGLMQRLLTRGIGHERFKFSEELGCEIPEEWEVVRLGDIADDFIGGGTPSTSNPDYWNGKIAWMTSAHISGRVITSGQRYITERGLNESSTNLIPKGNLLVATRVGIGKAAINSIDVAISQDLTGVIIKKDKVIADYVYWFLLNNSSRLKSLAQGSTIKGLLKDDLANLKIPLPPLPEQRRIAEILSTVDRKHELERRRREKLERIKRGMMGELLTGRKRVKAEAG